MNLNYDHSKNLIYLEENSEQKVICDNYPSRPVFSPNEFLAAYISPFEWEKKGKVYLINFNTLEHKEIYVPSDDKLNPKKIIWIDNIHLAMILGHTYGTIGTGGNIFIFNIENNVLNQLTHFSEEIQITDVKINSNILYISGNKYTDKNFMNKEEFYSEIKNF